MQMLSTTNYKEANKRPGRGGKHHVSIKPRVTISISFNQQYTGTSRTKEEYLREKVAYA